MAASPWDFRSSLLRGRGLCGDLELSITTLQAGKVKVTSTSQLRHQMLFHLVPLPGIHSGRSCPAILETVPGNLQDAWYMLVGRLASRSFFGAWNQGCDGAQRGTFPHLASASLKPPDMRGSTAASQLPAPLLSAPPVVLLAPVPSRPAGNLCYAVLAKDCAAINSRSKCLQSVDN